MALIVGIKNKEYVNINILKTKEIKIRKNKNPIQICKYAIKELGVIHYFIITQIVNGIINSLHKLLSLA